MSYHYHGYNFHFSQNCRWHIFRILLIEHNAALFFLIHKTIVGAEILRIHVNMFHMSISSGNHWHDANREQSAMLVYCHIF